MTPTWRLSRLTTVLAGLTSIALIAGTTTASTAAEPNANANAIARTVHDAAPAVKITQPPNAHGTLTAATASGQRVTIPGTANGALTLTTDAGLITIDLPGSDSAPAVTADDGTVTYDTRNTDIAVQSIADGARIQTILADRSAPTRFAYDLPGMTPQLNPDGSVSVTMPGDGFTSELAVIAPAWAVDANGNAVPTRYRVQGSTLVQEVDHRGGGVAYPVVADPTASVGWGVYIFYNRAETKTISTMGWQATGSAAICATAGALASPLGAVALGAACLIQFGSIVYTAGVAENSSPKQCVRLRYFLSTLTVATYLDSRCR